MKNGWFWFIACIGLILGLALYGCGKDSGGIVGPTQEFTDLSVSQAQATPVNPQASMPAGSVKLWDHGAADFNGPINKHVCYFVRGPHEQELLFDIPVNLAAGETKHVDVPKLPADTCVQVDVADNCDRSSIMPGLVAVTYVGPCDPTPEPTPTPPPVCEGDDCPCEGDQCEPTPEPSPTPEPAGVCYYEVDCRSANSFQAQTFCTYNKKKDICEDAGGEYLDTDPKFWVINYQCVFELPGISSDRFQLTPGQSDEGCLRKQDD